MDKKQLTGERAACAHAAPQGGRHAEKDSGGTKACHISAARTVHICPIKRRNSGQGIALPLFIRMTLAAPVSVPVLNQGTFRR
jgi:hypothetical protein